MMMKDMITNYVDYMKDEPDFKERFKAYVYTMLPPDQRSDVVVDLILSYYK